MAKQKKSRGKKIFLSVLCVLLGLILTAMLGVTIWVNSFLNQIDREQMSVQETLSDEEIDIILNETEPEDVDFTGEVIDPDQIDLGGKAEELIGEEDHVMNILLIGQDARPGQGRQRSDSMILCTVNTEKKTLVMTSFLRDLYVSIPDWNGKSYANNRLNVNYVFGGADMLNECLKQNFGVVVDHNIAVNFSGFEDVVDLVGGVDMELTSGEAHHVGGGARAGMNHLNGEQALNYARIRKLDSDFGRTNRQRKVLMAIFEKMKTLSLTELLKLVEGIIPLVSTNMSNGDIMDYVSELFPMLTDLEITTQTIPAEGTYKGASVRGMSVLVPDMEANRQILRDTLGE